MCISLIQSNTKHFFLNVFLNLGIAAGASDIFGKRTADSDEEEVELKTRVDSEKQNNRNKGKKYKNNKGRRW